MKVNKSKEEGSINDRVKNNSPYLKSMHKCLITQDTSLLFYPVNFKWALASHVFLLLIFTVWNASTKSGKDFYKTGNKSSASGLQENQNTSKF